VGARRIEHLGSAHDEAELAALKAVGEQRIAADQPGPLAGYDAVITSRGASHADPT
jgi:hypothetical protein